MHSSAARWWRLCMKLSKESVFNVARSMIMAPWMSKGLVNWWTQKEITRVSGDSSFQPPALLGDN